MNKIPVVIDTDPGVDDCIALLLALSSEKLDIKAITTLGGNVALKYTSRNALNICNYVGRNIKVAKGADKPLFRELETAEHVHGSDGLGYAKFEDSPYSLYEKNAVETIYEEAIKSEGNLNLIAVGPLTNIALLLLAYPDVKDMIKRITIMGGAIVGGNVTPEAEFNIYADPEAAKIVFEAGIPITMLGLDATEKAFIYKEEVEKILSHKNKISEQAEKLFESSLNVAKIFGKKGAVIHDALAVASVIEPDIIKTEYIHVDIETKGEFTLGKTVADNKKEPNVDVALDADREKFIHMLEEMMIKYGV